MAGVIAGQDSECRGFASDTEIYAFRVFTDAQVTNFVPFFRKINMVIIFIPVRCSLDFAPILIHELKFRSLVN